MKTHWIDFLRIMAMHRKSRFGNIPYEVTAGFEDTETNATAKRLDMITMPTGLANGCTAEAREWLADQKEEKTE